MDRRTFFWTCATLCLRWALSDCACAGSNQMRISSDQDQVQIRCGTKPLLTYAQVAGAFKPYVKELYTPNGRNILLDSPSDHVHHHGLMLAYKVAGTNFWEENAQCGLQIPQQGISSWVQTDAQTGTAGFSSDIKWQAPGKQTVLRETRCIEAMVHAGDAVTLVNWRSQLKGTTAGQAVTLTGDHYFGLGMRFIRAMDRTGAFINAKGHPGTVFRGDERLFQGHWCAYQVDLDGQAVTVAMFDHPDNPRPVTWFTMKTPFAYLAAALPMGANIRVGMEDNLYISRGVLAKSNAEQVEKAARIIREVGFEVATPDEARGIIGTKGKDKVKF